MNKTFIVFLILAFIFGQFARFEFGNGISLIGIDVVVGSFSLFWLIKTLLRRKKITSLHFIASVLFLGFCIQSLIVNLLWLSLPSAVVAFLYIVRFASYISLSFLVSGFSRSDIRWLKSSFLVLITSVISIGIFQYFYYPSLRNLFYLGWDDHLYRLFSVFLDPNFTGSLFVCFFLFLLWFFKDFKKYTIFKKIGLTGLVFLTLLSIFLTYSRTAYLMLITGGVIYLILIGKKKFVLLFAILITVMLFLTIDTKIEGLNPLRTVSTNARFTSYQIASDIFSRHSVLGVGFNAYRYAQNMYGYRTTGTWQTSHADAGTDNSFLFVLVTTGVLGFIAYLFLWSKILNNLIKQVKRGDYFSKIVLSTTLSLFVGAMFLNVLFYPFIMAWYFILIGLTENTSP